MHCGKVRYLVMWPIFLPILVPVAVNWHVVVNYHVYGQEPPSVRMDRVMRARSGASGLWILQRLARSEAVRVERRQTFCVQK